MEGLQGPEAGLEGSQRCLIKVTSEPWVIIGGDMLSTGQTSLVPNQTDSGHMDTNSKWQSKAGGSDSGKNSNLWQELEEQSKVNRYAWKNEMKMNFSFIWGSHFIPGVCIYLLKWGLSSSRAFWVVTEMPLSQEERSLPLAPSYSSNGMVLSAGNPSSSPSSPMVAEQVQGS